MFFHMREGKLIRLITSIAVLICFLNVACFSAIAEEITQGKSDSVDNLSKEAASSEKLLPPSEAVAEQTSKAPITHQETGRETSSSDLSNEVSISDPVGIFSGRVTEDITDLRVPSKGRLTMEVERHYNSALSTEFKLQSFGPKWVFNYDTYCHTPDYGDTVYWNKPDGVRLKFTKSGDTYTSPTGSPYELTRGIYGHVIITQHPGGNRWVFDNSGTYEAGIFQLASIQDRNYNKIAMSYGANDRITKATEDGGNDLDFEYDASDRITKITDPDGNEYKYGYNLIGGKNLVVWYPNSSYVHEWYQMDSDYLLNDKYRIHDGSAWESQWSFDYDGDDKCTKVTYPDNSYDEIDFVSSSRTDFTDALGRTTEYYYDADNLVTKETDANNISVYYYYDADGNRTRMTDGRSQNYYYYYDDDHNMTRETKPGSIDTDYTYNDDRQITSILDELGNQTDYYYDGYGNLMKLVDELGAETLYEYDGDGQKTLKTDPNDNDTEYEYDGYGLLTKIINAVDGETTYAYDVMGNRTSETDPNGITTDFEYDEMNQVTKTTDDLDNYVTYEYDRKGNRTKITDKNGNDTDYEFNWQNKVTKITDAESNVTEFAYDEIGNLTKLTDAESNVTEFDYDFGAGCGCGGTGNLVTKITYPDLNYETFKYDANGNLTKKADCNGDDTTYAFDALNRLTKKTYEDNSTTEFYYDEVGNMTKAEDDDSTLTFDFDNVYRLIETTQKLYGQPTYTIEYEYDAAGNRTSMTDPNLTGPTDPKIEYTYNALNQLASVTDVYINATNYYYDDAGRLTNLTNGNGTEADYSYDAVNRLTLIENKKSGGSEISTFYYAYDKENNQTWRADDAVSPSKTLTYAYNNIYQIVEVYHVEETETLEEFSYDDAGNRTSDSNFTDYTYNSNNQLTTYGSGDVNLYYDKNGNLTKVSKPGIRDTSYSYNYENRLVRIDYPDSDYSTYKYDPSGRRIEKRDKNGTISRYLYDGKNIIAEYNGSNALVASYVQRMGIDEHISMYRGGEMYWYHKDFLGSICQMTDENETVVRMYDYAVFGEIISETGSLANPFTYIAREFDRDSGLYYNRARHYDATKGRFLKREPSGINEGYNLYVYTDNNPVTWVDKDGLQKFYPVIPPTILDPSYNCMGYALGGPGAGWRQPPYGYPPNDTPPSVGCLPVAACHSKTAECTCKDVWNGHIIMIKEKVDAWENFHVYRKNNGCGDAEWWNKPGKGGLRPALGNDPDLDYEIYYRLPGMTITTCWCCPDQDV